MKKKLLNILMLLPIFASAQNWSDNSSINNLVAGIIGTSSKSGTVTSQDAQKNVFVAWVDSRNATTGNDIYIQKINKDGSVAWAANGIPVCTATGAQSNIAMVADGNNGVLLVWQDGRTATNQSYVQRVNADGTMAYATDGVNVSPNSFSQVGQAIELVNASEAIVLFRDSRNGNADLFARKIAISTGAAVWASDVTVVDALGLQTQQTLVADGLGGAYFAWADPRIATTNSDIFVQRITSAGTVSWATNGVNITSGVAGNQNKPSIELDPNGGFFITWQDLRTGSTDGDIYAQKVNADGTVAWTVNGVLVCSAANTQDSPTLVTDGNNGIIVAWSDPRDGLGATVRKLFAQRVNSAGVPQWTANGVSVATGHILASTTDFKLLQGNATGTAIIAWQDSRNSATTGNDIYAQKLNANGTRGWADGGLVVCNAANVQGNVGIETDGSDNVITIWTDSRSGTTNAEIYASKISSLGFLPVTFAGISAKQNQSSVVINWKIASEVNTLHYAIERSNSSKNFVEIGKTAATKSNAYNYTDFNPLVGNAYYRIKAVDNDGKLSYSDIVYVNTNLATTEATIFPNPFTSNLKIKLSKVYTDKIYEIKLVDVLGKVHYRELVAGNKLQESYSLDFGNIFKGLYYLIVTQENTKFSYPVIKQ